MLRFHDFMYYLIVKQDFNSLHKTYMILTTMVKKLSLKIQHNVTRNCNYTTATKSNYKEVTKNL